VTSPRIDTDALRRSANLLALLPPESRPWKRTGTGTLVRCSFHEDLGPSMLVSLTDAGWKYWCYGCGAGGDVIRYVMETRKLRFLDAARALGGDALPPPVNALKPSTRGEAPRAKGGQPRGRIVAKYDYCDEQGELLYQVVRLDPKAFLQRRPRPEGGWLWTIQGVRRVLYRLPELLSAHPNRRVFIVEGEKDADNLRATGRIATTNAGGAGKWRPEYGEALRGRRVVIVPDNDGPGHTPGGAGAKHAEQVRSALAGMAAEAVIRRLPQGFKDVSEWLASHDIAGDPTRGRPTR
jgi:DNA primase